MIAKDSSDALVWQISNALILWRDYEFVYGLLSQLMLYHSLLSSLPPGWIDLTESAAFVYPAFISGGRTTGP